MGALVMAYGTGRTRKGGTVIMGVGIPQWELPNHRPATVITAPAQPRPPGTETSSQLAGKPIAAGVKSFGPTAPRETPCCRAAGTPRGTTAP
jgi:hypothetical protein